MYHNYTDLYYAEESFKDVQLTDKELKNKIRHLEEENRKLRQNEARLESLLELSQKTGITEEEIRDFAFETVVSITGNEIGYLHFYNEDNRTINLVSWSKAVLKNCNAEKTLHYPIDRAGIWADSVRLRRPVVHNDFRNEPGRKGLPIGHIHVNRHLSVPIFDQGKIVAIAGVGNKADVYDESDIKQTMLFMNHMWTILKQKKAEEILRKYSLEDGLTGLANRRRFDEVIEIEWWRASRNKYPLSVILLDIDHFKAYNDSYGHQSGDDCLKRIGGCLKRNIHRAGEMAARYGGEEFVIVLPVVRFKDALNVADLMRENIFDMKIPHASSSISEYVTVSAGVASMVPERANLSSHLIQSADRSLYRAKREGRNRVCGDELSG